MLQVSGQYFSSKQRTSINTPRLLIIYWLYSSYLCRLWQYYHSHSAGVHAALFLCLRDSLDPMHACFKLHLLVAQWTTDAGCGMSYTP